MLKSRLFLLFSIATIAPAKDHVVHDTAELVVALKTLAAGDVVKLAPGDYSGGHHCKNLENLTLEALHTKSPPRIVGGNNAFQFSKCPGLSLRNLVISGQTQNGLNIDDGGDFANLVNGATLEGLSISDIGPKGNHDGIKCSGLKNILIKECMFSGWAGQGIDFVGCHQSKITGCKFTGKPGYEPTAAIQLKGGTADILVENCHFIDAGLRPLNLGGSTGLSYFRPHGATYEAARLTVTGNVIEGSQCAAAFVGVDGATFSRNTINYPTKWIFRILQETQLPEFVPCRNVQISSNVINFRRSSVQTDINIGVKVDSQSFQFIGNQWFAEDNPQLSKPKLPVAEKDGIHGVPKSPK